MIVLERHVASMAIFAAVTIAALSPALAAGDAGRGEQVFRQCAACHSFDPAERRPGPHLQGLFGRTAGTVEGFRYSDAMAGSGIVWDDATLSAYLLDPRGNLPGTRKPVGLRDEADIQDVLAYLRQEGG